MTNDTPSRLSVWNRPAQPPERHCEWREPTPYPFKLGALRDALAAAQAEGAPDTANVSISSDAVVVNWIVIEDPT